MHIPGVHFRSEEGLFFVQVLDALFRCAFSGHDDFRVEIEIEGDIRFR